MLRLRNADFVAAIDLERSQVFRFYRSAYPDRVQ